MADNSETILAVGVTGVVAAGAAYAVSRATDDDSEQSNANTQQNNSGLSAAMLAALLSGSGGSSGQQEQAPPDAWGAGDPAESWHTVTITGDSETGDTYNISVSGQARMGGAAESPDDSAGNGEISGVIDSGIDTYEFTGSVTDLQLPTHAEVSVDGTVIRARNAGSGTRPGSSVPNNLMNPGGDSSPDAGASGENSGTDTVSVDGYEYAGSAIDVFTRWANGEVSTDYFQTATGQGDGTASVLNRDSLGDPDQEETVVEQGQDSWDDDTGGGDYDNDGDSDADVPGDPTDGSFTSDEEKDFWTGNL